MPQVHMPQRRDDSQAFTVVGAAAGAAFGNPMAGASAGQTIGSMSQRPQAQPVQSTAMSRRQDSMQNDRLKQLREGENALATLPPDLQKQYAPAIAKASYMEEKNRGMV